MLPHSVREVYFSDYYRVLVVEEDDKVFVSVDVYKKGFDYPVTRTSCVKEDFCLIYSTLDPALAGPDLKDVTLSLEVVGSKTPGGVETLNVRWVLRKPLGEDVLRKVFETSWLLIRAKPTPQ
ncbi:MAG: hypothetical protein ACP5HP_02985 [Thermogladius sp.]